MEDLANALHEDFKKDNIDNFVNIDRSKIIEFFKDIRMALFLNYYKSKPSVDDINKLLTNSKLDFIDGIKDLNLDSLTLVNKFYSRLTVIRNYLKKDIKAIYDGDPACNSLTEVVLTYPGFIAISAYRIAHEIYNIGLKSVARIISEYAHSKTGIDINSGATIGESFFIDHGTGIVIGETSIIGNNVKIYQGVTLGALSLKDGRLLKDKKRHPTIEDNVTIYSNASIFGGDTIIGHDSTIGSNTFITESVEPFSIIKNCKCNKEIKK